MATTMRIGSAAYKMVRATLVITTPLPSLENSSKRDAAQPKKAFKTSTFVLRVHRLGTDVEYALVPFICALDAQPYWGGNWAPAWHGKSLGCDSRAIEAVCLVVTALATKPANITEKMDAWNEEFHDTGYLRGIMFAIRCGRSDTSQSIVRRTSQALRFRAY